MRDAARERFGAYGVAAYPNAQHLTQEQMHGLDGSSTSIDYFTSDDVAEQVIAYFSNQFGNQGTVDSAGGICWEVSSVPGCRLCVYPADIAKPHPFQRHLKESGILARSVIFVYRREE